MLDDDNESLLADEMDSELAPHLRDPGLLKAFAALEEDLRAVVGQIASEQFDEYIFQATKRTKARGRSLMVVASTNHYLPYGIACMRCNDSLVAPDWSKYLSERHVSHSWSCDSCGHRFETSHHLRFNAHPSEPLFG